MEERNGQKPDIIIRVGESEKNISVKIGNGNSVHQENIDIFKNFLTEISIPENIELEILKFHWGDGTIDGTGANRISGSQYKSEYPNKISLINTEINHKEHLEKCINRFIFQGKSADYDEVDAVYYGDSNNGHWASKEEIMNYIMLNRFNANSIHFGPLNYQVWNRCLNHNPKTEERRKVMQIKWGTLLEDLLKIERNRKNNE